MRVLFLDIDGVLNSCVYYRSRRSPDSCVDESRVRLLKNIVEETGTVLVLSSSWRIYWRAGVHEYDDPQMAELMGLFEKYGLRIHSRTPQYEPEVYQKKLEELGPEAAESVDTEYGIFSYARVFEIQAWLREHEGAVESFIILDDNDFCWRLLGFESHWVQTSWEEEGLSRSQAAAAVKILKGRAE